MGEKNLLRWITEKKKKKNIYIYIYIYLFFFFFSFFYSFGVFVIAKVVSIHTGTDILTCRHVYFLNILFALNRAPRSKIKTKYIFVLNSKPVLC